MSLLDNNPHRPDPILVRRHALELATAVAIKSDDVPQAHLIVRDAGLFAAFVLGDEK